MPYRPRLRAALIGACTAALLATGSGLLALPAQAEGLQAAPAATAARADSASETTVRNFFTEYVQAEKEEHPGRLDPTQVREKYLTPALESALSTWEDREQTDAIFRRNDVPTSWSVVETGTADGHAKLTLTETWGNGSTTDVRYEVDLASQKIDGLTA
ncbi:hypothetical protein SAVIM338S_06283 [Streptomyces avidinii]